MSGLVMSFRAMQYIAKSRLFHIREYLREIGRKFENLVERHQKGKISHGERKMDET
jgi:hypothetical protein